MTNLRIRLDTSLTPVVELPPGIYQDTEVAPRIVYYADHPIDFATGIELSQHLDTELVKGVMLHRSAAQYSHEKVFSWLFAMLGSYAGKRKLGVVLGSRTAVKISEHDGRLPDILFVRADNTAIIHNDAIYGVPDLVIEIVSPNDYPYNLTPLETDYRTLGVPEIVFINPQKKSVRLIQKNATGYTETTLTTGRLTFASVPDFWIELEWLFSETPPDAFDVTRQLLEDRV